MSLLKTKKNQVPDVYPLNTQPSNNYFSKLGVGKVTVKITAPFSDNCNMANWAFPRLLKSPISIVYNCQGYKKSLQRKRMGHSTQAGSCKSFLQTHLFHAWVGLLFDNWKNVWIWPHSCSTPNPRKGTSKKKSQKALWIPAIQAAILNKITIFLWFPIDDACNI